MSKLKVGATHYGPATVDKACGDAYGQIRKALEDGIEPERGDVVQLEPFVGRSPLSALPPHRLAALPPPLAASGGRARWDAAISSRGMLGLDALIDLQVIHRMLPRRHPEGR